jgi:hypothetical protein
MPQIPWIIAGLEKYKFSGNWTQQAIYILMYSALVGSYQELEEIEAHTSLKMPDGNKTLGDMIRYVLKEVGAGRQAKKYSLDIKTDQEAVEQLGVGTTEQLSIRRTRWDDCKAATGIPHVNLLANMGYIGALNLSYAAHLHGPEFLFTLAALNALESQPRYQEVTAIITRYVKKEKMAMTQRLRYAECGTLTGYRLLSDTINNSSSTPGKAFDVLDEAKLLAEGGEEHGLSDWDQRFTEGIKEVMAGQVVRPVPWMTLEEYIASEVWRTSGASSYGRVEYILEKKEKHFKARKNFLLDVYTPQELAGLVLEHAGEQTSTAFVKPELGKLRVAVTGDLWTYLMMSYLAYLSAESYTTWVGNTLEERRLEQMIRMELTLMQLEGCYSLPFDYKAYDHQPTTKEIQELATSYFQNALFNTPEEHKDAIRRMIKWIERGFQSSWCTIVINGKKESILVLGGLQSGIRVTSLIGNMWNQVVTAVVLKMLGRVKEHLKASYIRGDDSTSIWASYMDCVAMRLGYASVNAIGHDSKYGIHHEETEFLRIWYTKYRVYGYPNRAIPGIVQRKPWTSEPWDPNASEINAIKSLRIAARRLSLDTTEMEEKMVRVYMKKKRLPIEIARVPVSMGGLGILPWTGAVPSDPYPRVPARVAEFKVHPESWRRYEEEVRKVVPTADIPEKCYRERQQEQMALKASADDIPNYRRTLRQIHEKLVEKWKKGLRWVQHRIRTWGGSIDLWQMRALRSLSTVQDIRVYDNSCEAGAKYFGKHKCEQEWATAAWVASVTGTRTVDIFSEIKPEAMSAIKELEKRGMHRTDAVSFVSGKVALTYTTPLHEVMYRTVELTVAAAIEQIMEAKHKITRMDWAWITTVFTIGCEQGLAFSQVVERLTRY